MRSGSGSYILTMDPELENICSSLEREATSRERNAAPTCLLQDLLQELDGQDDHSEVFLEPPAVDVDAEISHACCLDQIAILQAYESGLDQVFFIYGSGLQMTFEIDPKYFFPVRLHVLSRLC